MGVLRRVQPARGAHLVRGQRAGAYDPDWQQAEQEGDRDLGQIREAESECRHLCYHEPGVCRALQLARQLEAAVPGDGHDHSRQDAYRPGELVQPGLSERGALGRQGRLPLRPLQGPVIVAAALRLRPSFVEGRPRVRRLHEAGLGCRDRLGEVVQDVRGGSRRQRAEHPPSGNLRHLGAKARGPGQAIDVELNQRRVPRRHRRFR
mmetsp:Transcript_125260/g.362417  ORF Transcript_125260/g.362417 Transcript_125260/m.362417 type:complete len:206 (+) Transcript_125260:4042-4659(+)